jgi:hypothetical protein
VTILPYLAFAGKESPCQESGKNNQTHMKIRLFSRLDRLSLFKILEKLEHLVSDASDAKSVSNLLDQLLK